MDVVRLAGDALSYHRDRPFSTIDNDYTSTSCCLTYPGGWWFNECYTSNLNYRFPDKASNLWLAIEEQFGVLRMVQMSLRRAKPLLDGACVVVAS